jgi:hypothetical protein
MAAVMAAVMAAALPLHALHGSVIWIAFRETLVGTLVAATASVSAGDPHHVQDEMDEGSRDEVTTEAVGTEVVA